MTENEQLKLLEIREQEYTLPEVIIAGVPIWEIIKHPLREKYLVKVGCSERVHNKKNAISIKSFIYVLRSLVDAHKLMLGLAKGSNFLMGFSRFEKIGDIYVDKYIDPLVAMTDIKSDHIYIEYGTHGYHLSQRPNCSRYFSDYINIISFFVGTLNSLYYRLRYRNKLTSFCEKISSCLGWNIDIKYVSSKLSIFLVQIRIYKMILKRCKAKRVIGVSRILFKHVSFAAKQLGLPVYELQHGITLGKTSLYAGPYNPNIDPDFFLMFGEECPRTVFGIPEERTINIGWAFFDYLKDIDKTTHKDRCLFISSAEISDRILSVAKDLALTHPNMYFDIRRHPMEIYSKQQKALIDSIPNVVDVSSLECSAAAIVPYEYVLGEGSSVLFEALCMGKKVARIACNGIELTNRSDDDAFYYLDDLSQFDDFLKAPHKELKKRAYTKFNKDLFNSLLK